MNTFNPEKIALLDHLLSAESPEELDLRLEQLLTPTEYDEIIKRLQIFRMLEDGIPQRQIAQKLGVGIATVSRGARALKPS
ncbi:Trp family transcriptional regulator [Reinekea blandensis]|uniref:Putative Trp operon transcriptional repressor n=1 Tax=Reinekea blandensis MED297 TaxID=314283 RepID=A4BEX1_9GAMM|nr:Trp family transcriptional regulator [Reinekea blandensis]EAR09306.1 putative Trp operon transcriptional repressor [Reinekea sp. MED297] [Reinekea blandensis MED297]